MSWKEIHVHDLDLQGIDVLVDVREQDEYADGHIPGAINIPLSSLEENFADIPTSGVVHVVCRSGARSASACDFLTQQTSHSTVSFVNVGGGTMGWIVVGREVVTGDTPR